MAPNLMPQASSVLATGACGVFDDRSREGCVASNSARPAGAQEQALNESLSASANRPAYRERREPPQLVPAADGGYDFTNRAYDGVYRLFRAHIAADGAVRFDDGANVQLAPIPTGIIFDLDRALDRGEAHIAEKRWFLDQTAALRSRLANAARAAEDRRARRMVESTLERIGSSST